MRAAARALSPDARRETRPPTRKHVAAAPGCSAPRAGKEGDRKGPPSILRHSSPPGGRGRRAQPARAARHVRFQEPLEVAVRYIASREHVPPAKAPRRPRPRPRGRLLLLLGLCALLVLLLGLCCGRIKPLALALQDLRARLLALGLRLRQALLTGWHCLLQL
ncbi:nutritionally-regulated adipose and cardiac enriched protein homolog [Pipistrellus kuhlii]|uniref:Nutritionally-regulated adipose and cardiac-enriched n=1 Tax=Pipistrellus kuhlii TaxID=59472 RepID=A0A7J7R0F6_PIPKU|nr:nutritionally-regulated adipose and cardiac enriched protein homolog [Pipistrellus kuhlii]KAF6269626.1 nutritionally-regulated adipose and cardiac-enriched [Pipistrellus kuhlii]